MSGSEVGGGLDRSGATRVAVVSLAVAVALAAAKLLVGVLGGSLGVLSDGLHSSWPRSTSQPNMMGNRQRPSAPARSTLASDVIRRKRSTS